MNIYIIKDIVAYTNPDTKLILNKLTHFYKTKIDTTEPYKYGSYRQLEHLLRAKKVITNIHWGEYNEEGVVINKNVVVVKVKG